jgi:Tfp pilus assembly protein PilO
MFGIIGALGLSAASYQFYFDPSYKEVSAIYRQIEDHNNKINTARRHSAMTKKMEEEITVIEKQLNSIRSKIAVSGEIIPIIKTIEKEAQRLNLKVLNMSTKVIEPPPPASDEEKDSKTDADAVIPGHVSGYVKVSFNISLQGRYDKLENFVKVLQNMATFLIIETMEIDSNVKLYPQLVSNLLINVYSKKEAGDIVVSK